MFVWLVVSGLVVVLGIVRLYSILPKRIKQGGLKLDKSKQQEKLEFIKTLVVLGSGGHTGEMMDIIQTLDPKRYKLEFVLADTDSTSEKFVRNLLKDKSDFEPLSFHYIPRSREVHQSYLTSIFTTLKALLYTTVITNVNINPDLIIVNGPGTCIPICISAYLTRFFGIKHAKIIFIESVCRVDSLSASGKIMYILADRFLVHWPQLQHKHKNVEYHGRMCY